MLEISCFMIIPAKYLVSSCNYSSEDFVFPVTVDHKVYTVNIFQLLQGTWYFRSSEREQTRKTLTRLSSNFHQNPDAMPWILKEISRPKVFSPPRLCKREAEVDVAKPDNGADMVCLFRENGPSWVNTQRRNSVLQWLYIRSCPLKLMCYLSQGKNVVLLNQVENLFQKGETHHGSNNELVFIKDESWFRRHCVELDELLYPSHAKVGPDWRTAMSTPASSELITANRWSSSCSVPDDFL